jgi:hypothetical protein
MLPLRLSWRIDNARTSVLLQFQASMAASAGVLFFAAILADGNEFQKHLFPFTFLFDCCLIADAV